MIYIYRNMKMLDTEALEALNFFSKSLYADAEEVKIVEDKKSTRMHWTERVLYDLIKNVMRKDDDKLIIYNAKHVTFSNVQFMQVVEFILSRNVHCYFMKYDTHINNTIKPIKLLQLIDTASHELLSGRFKKRREAGLSVGRPRGRKNKSLKLDKFKDEIEKYLDKGINKSTISKLIGCHQQTLYDWLKRKENRS